MIKFQSFLSSSSGNATYVTDDNTSILIDCGATGSYIEKCLARVQANGTQLSGIFLTHAHTDHIAGAGILSRKYGIPLYATEETFIKATRQLGCVSDENKRIVKSGEDIRVGTLNLHVFSLSHDAEGAVSYTVTDGETKFGIATDSGVVTEEILQNLTGCETVIVESNHDENMLLQGPYPHYLKKRILSDTGHLSNNACGELCAMLAKSGTHAFWLGHLSDENNVPDLAYACVQQTLEKNGFTVGSDVALHVIPKFWIEGTI